MKIWYYKIIAHFFYLNDDKKIFKWLHSKINVSTPPQMEKVILIDFTHLAFKKWTFQLFMMILAIQNQYQLKIHAFYPSAWFLWSSYTPRLIWLIKLITRKETRMLKKFGVRGICRASYLEYLFTSKSNNSWNLPKSKKDLLELKIEGILVGDLIYDTYLKQYNQATIDIHDKRLIKLYEKVFFLIQKFNDYIDNNKIEEIWLTHSVYLAFGTIARLGLEKGLNVYCYQNNMNKIFHRLTVEDCNQRGGFSKFKELFNELEDKPECIKKGKELIHSRIDGNLDKHLTFMKKSAYSSDIQDIEIQNKKDTNILIMLHCFFDSPHIYKYMLFPDFYEWVIHTVKKADKLGYGVFIKPHPNGIKGNDKIINKLINDYPKINMLPKSVGNHQIALEFDAIFTIFGTVGYEMPLLGVPVITAGDSPYRSYNFCFHSDTLDEYNHNIENIPHLKDSFNNNYQSEIYEFMYMMNLYHLAGTSLIYTDKTVHLNNFELYDTLIQSIEKEYASIINSIINAYNSVNINNNDYA